MDLIESPSNVQIMEAEYQGFAPEQYPQATVQPDDSLPTTHEDFIAGTTNDHGIISANDEQCMDVFKDLQRPHEPDAWTSQLPPIDYTEIECLYLSSDPCASHSFSQGDFVLHIIGGALAPQMDCSFSMVGQHICDTNFDVFGEYSAQDF
ncbi:hypothetical protein MPH_05979 [Macrophomina phaseolina MS6]|uniref:Uncharacterized protein n=1 Tax=Macrophomina phaseolina (strain MS6) TaxID=1126212 RepID=K2R387_MACPH|nr:hypothetical protein MPH_05979 [Macrophomina phaseolina MS6]